MTLQRTGRVERMTSHTTNTLKVDNIIMEADEFFISISPVVFLSI